MADGHGEYDEHGEHEGDGHDEYDDDHEDDEYEDDHEHDGPMPEIRKIAYLAADAEVIGNMKEFRRLLKEFRRLLVENPDTTTTLECSCGCLETDNIFKLLRTIGRFPAELYKIAFKTGHLSKMIEYGSTDTKVQNTTEMVDFVFCFMINKFKNWHDGTIIIPVEKAQENIMKTIDVFYSNFEKNDGLNQYAWIGKRRTEYLGDMSKYDYPPHLPTYICCNFMNYIINPTQLDITETFVWDLLLKLYDLGMPFPDHITEWVDDKSRPIVKPAKEDEEDEEDEYVRVLHIMSPIQAIIGNGGLHALKGLYERDPEMVRKSLIDVDTYVEEFRSTIKYWKTTSWKTTSYYEKYHANADDILAKMESFIASIMLLES